MFLKRLKLTNYRKFSSEKNIVEFISSKIVLNQDNDDINDNFEENSVQNDCDEIDVASDTTLIIGKNNAGKTTIITALDNLINHNNAFGANDFNYRYLQEYLDCYDVCNPPLGAPYIEFVLTVGLEEDSNDRISNFYFPRIFFGYFAKVRTTTNVFEKSCCFDWITNNFSFNF